MSMRPELNSAETSLYNTAPKFASTQRKPALPGIRAAGSRKTFPLTGKPLKPSPAVSSEHLTPELLLLWGTALKFATGVTRHTPGGEKTVTLSFLLLFFPSACRSRL